MDIHLDFNPGDYCWVMKDNFPVQLIVYSATIVCALDMSKKNVTFDVKYYLSLGAIGGEYSAKSMYHTKEELKESIFG